MSDQHKPVNPKQSFPALEEATLKRWRQLDVMQKSVVHRTGAKQWVFYEGPPTANGKPGSHHVLSRVFKDIFTRYKSMCGYRVQRKGGWDCHGLPVELAVEAELGISSKEDIEKYGIAEFNERCRDSVFRYVEEWNKLTERIAFWVDLDNAYHTLDSSYVESVWWALRQIWDKQLLYEGHKVVPYCPRCGTALSSHEVSLGYKDVSDPSVYVRFPVIKPTPVLQEGDTLLVWTTTPWTLPANGAVAVDPELTYVRAEVNGERFVLAKPLVERVLGESAQIVDEFPGQKIVGASYEPPFTFIAGTEFGEKGHTVLPGDFVTAEDGTGIVHAAVAFGDDDYRLGEKHGLNVVNPVQSDGTYDERIGPYAGRFVKDVDADLVEELKGRLRLFRAESYQHSYPHCWRCSTPLLYYAKPSWYIATSQLKDRLLAANGEINWYPGHVKDGRFGKWLENNVDWAVSRERYWGTPLPIWRCSQGHTVCVGSFAELQELSGVELSDPHRPYVDEVRFTCSQCDGQMDRVPEVVDAWFDSGSMPFAEHHAPFTNKDTFEERFPADFICEALDQTRGWFYSLLAISTLLYDKPAYKNVLCLGLIVDEHGQKMSKSKGNVVEPWQVLNDHGADAFRWYYFTSKHPWDNYRFSTEAVGDAVRHFLLQLWNTYGFYVLYANTNSVSPLEVKNVIDKLTDLDRWVLSRLHTVVATVRERLDSFDATVAGRTVAGYVDELSNWYVRRSRRRFWEGDAAAFATLRHCLVTVAQLLAPFTPFIADEIYLNLAVDGVDSVHLSDYPTPDDVGTHDPDLEFAMQTARDTVRLGLAARAQAKVKIRQPLRTAIVVATAAERAAIERHSETVCEELNVKELRYVSAADQLAKLELKPNYRTLGPRFGKEMPQVAAAVRALDPQKTGAVLQMGKEVDVTVGGRECSLSPDDLQVVMRPLAGYQVEQEGKHAVALDLELDEQLVREGLARELVRAVQGSRKDAGLAVEDRIELALAGDDDLLQAARAHDDYVRGETLAVNIEYPDALEGGVELKVAGHRLVVRTDRCN